MDENNSVKQDDKMNNQNKTKNTLSSENQLPFELEKQNSFNKIMSFFRHKDKILLFFASLFIIAIILLTFNYIIFSTRRDTLKQTSNSPQTTPTTEVSQNTAWKTYSNQKLGFSVNYPRDWQTKEFSRDFAIIGKSSGVAFRPIDPKIVNENWGLVTIEVEDNPSNLTAEDFINNYLCDSPGVCASAEKATPITVSGVQGKRVINPPAPVSSQITVLMNNKQVFTIAVTLDKSFEEMYSIQQKEDIYNQMLTFFKFSEQSSTVVNGWPFYKSKNYNFSFKYRPDLEVEELEKRITLLYKGTLEPYDKLFHATVYIVDNPNNYTPQQYSETELCKDAIKFPNGTDTTNYCLNLVKDNMEDYKNNSVTGVKTQYNLYENPTVAIIFPFENKLILFLSSGETGGLPTEMGMQTIDQVLSTFQFSK